MGPRPWLLRLIYQSELKEGVFLSFYQLAMEETQNRGEKDSQISPQISLLPIEQDGYLRTFICCHLYQKVPKDGSFKKAAMMDIHDVRGDGSDCRQRTRPLVNFKRETHIMLVELQYCRRHTRQASVDTCENLDTQLRTRIPGRQVRVLKSRTGGGAKSCPALEENRTAGGRGAECNHRVSTAREEQA